MSLLELKKFVSDCTMNEITKKLKPAESSEELMVFTVSSWLSLNHMNINIKKTKEMLFGSITKNLPPLLQMNGHLI